MRMKVGLRSAFVRRYFPGRVGNAPGAQDCSRGDRLGLSGLLRASWEVDPLEGDSGGLRLQPGTSVVHSLPSSCGERDIRVRPSAGRFLSAPRFFGTFLHWGGTIWEGVLVHQDG